MKVTGPLFKWFGSKWLSSRLLPSPLRNLVIEPFAGSAGYSLRYAAGKPAILAEIDPHLRVLWKWLIEEASASEIRDIPINLPEGLDIRTLGLSTGQATLLKSWQRTNNVGNCWTVSPWGNKPGQWTENTRARVAEEFEACRLWAFLDDANSAFGDYSSGEENDLSGADVTWFIDPPYRFNYQYKASIGQDYARLGEIVRSLKGQIIVCEARHPDTGEMPNWLPFSDFGKRITSRRKKSEHHHSKELIWSR